MKILRWLITIGLCTVLYAASVIASAVVNDESIPDAMSTVHGFIEDKVEDAHDWAIDTMNSGKERIENSTIMQSVEADRSITDITKQVQGRIDE